MVLRALVLFVIGVSRASGQDGEPIPEKELPEFLGPVSPDQFTWRVVNAVDFDVYYGKANPPLDGSVGFYLGFAPQELEPGQTTVKSRLGRFPVKWHRSIGPDGAIEQEGMIVIDGASVLTAHVWANGANENQLENLLSVVGKLPIFASGAIPARFAEIHDDMAAEQRGRRLIWACWWVLLIAVAWLVDRFCRRRESSAAVRVLSFATVIALAIAATIGGATMSHFSMYWFKVAKGFLLLTAAGALCVVTLLLGSGLALFRSFRTRNSRRNLKAS